VDAQDGVDVVGIEGERPIDAVEPRVEGVGSAKRDRGLKAENLPDNNGPMCSRADR
jgi:hypothetical protein